jgi:hypothetical protein
MVDPDELLSDDESAAILNVKPKTMPQWRCRGFGPVFIKIGRKVFYRRSALYAWIAAQERDPAAKRRAA